MLEEARWRFALKWHHLCWLEEQRSQESKWKVKSGIRPGDQIHQIVKHLLLKLRNRDRRKTGENSQALWELL